MQTLQILNEYFSELNAGSITLRVILALVCGGVIGLDREKIRQPAGMRTYMLVSLGAAISMATGQYIYETFGAGDPGRLGAQVVSGIGFLGAGSIVITSQKNSSGEEKKVRGLTTAAGMWASACIGLAFGIGFYSAGIISTFAVYLILTQMKRTELRFLNEAGSCGVYIEYEDHITTPELIQQLSERGLEIEELQVEYAGGNIRKARLTIRNDAGRHRDEILALLWEIPDLVYVKYIS